MVAEKVNLCIARLLGFCDADKNGIKPESRLENDLGMDSLDQIELAMMLEVEIADEDTYRCATVADVVAMVQRAAGEVVA